MRTTAETVPRISTVKKAVLPLFLISGAAGLVYEVTWTRAFGVVFGNTVFAVSTVLTAFMLGLAAGSWFFGKIADKASHPLRLYAFLELSIGAYGLLFPAILTATDHFYLWFFRSVHPTFYPLSIVRFALSAVILFIPTALMGGTLPVLTRLWATPSRKKVRDPGIGQSVGVLYAVNTLGAVAGSFLAGYLLLRLLGVSSTIFLAASANIAVGTLALVLSAWTSKQRGQLSPRERKRSKDATAKAGTRSGDKAGGKQLTKKRHVVLVAVAVGGFCALALEVLWTRVLVFVLTTSVYAFACMLTCFLLGIAIGSFLCSRLVLARIRKPVLTLGIVELLIALSALASIPLLGKLWQIDYMLTWKLRASGFGKEVVAHFIDASVVLLLPTMLMGAAFPIAVKAYAESWKAAGKRVGEVYALNTIGCVVGSFAAGFVMVPLLGLRDSFLLIVATQLLLGVLVIFLSEKREAALAAPVGAFSVAVLVIAVLVIPRDVFVRTMNTYHYPSRVVYIKDDATGTVTVHDLPDGDRLIAVDGVDVAGVSLMLRTTQKLQGYVPLLIHQNPKKVLQIGFGSGETSGVGLAFGVEEYSIVEICPGVFESGKFFQNINRGSYKDPRLRKIIMDGKNFVKLSDEKFDIIMNDSTYPGTTGSSALYTSDHFRQCRERLRDNGVLSCWVPLDLRLEDFQIIVRSFQDAMPHSSLWMSNNSLNKHALLLGTLSPLRIDFQRVRDAVERPDIASDLAVINIHSVYDLLDCLVVDEKGLRRISGKGPLHTDDRPFLEFGATIKRDLDQCFMAILQQIFDHHSPIQPHLVTLGKTEEETQEVRATLEQYFRGTGHALRGLLAMLHPDPDAMHHEFEMARKANPLDRDLDSCLDEMKSEINALVEAVERMPRNNDLRWRLAKRYLLMRNHEKAAEQFAAFLEIAPEDAGAWNNLGVCYKGMKNFAEAVWALNKALRFDRNLVSAHSNLGEIHDEQGDFSQAARDYQKVISLRPRYLPAYLNLSRAHFRQKEYTQALDAIERALRLAPDNSLLLNLKQSIMRAAQGIEP